jgi:hypothetical protein
MNDDPNSSEDLNPCWDYVEPECRWVPQCHRMHIPGACEQCESLNPNPDVPLDEAPEFCSIPGESEDSAR